MALVLFGTCKTLILLINVIKASCKKIGKKTSGGNDTFSW